MTQKRSKTPTLRDVATLANVSLSTVSYCLNHDAPKKVSAELRSRVMDAVEALNYHPNYLARGMRVKNRRILAIVVPQFENVFFTRVINGAERIAYDNNYMLLFCSTYDDPVREQMLISNFVAQQVDGFLIAPTFKGWNNVKFIWEHHIPFVVLDRYLEGAEQPYDRVSFDNELGAYQATKHLIEMGHNKLAYLNWDSPFMHIQKRQEGFWRALDEAGIPRAECPIFSGRPNAEEGYRLAEALFARFEPTAVLTAHHYLAEGLVMFLRDTGRAIPNAVSVITHGQPSWVRLNIPNFTCIQPPAYEIGQLGARTLLNRIKDPDLPHSEIILKPSLILRNSVKQLHD